MIAVTGIMTGYKKNRPLPYLLAALLAAVSSTGIAQTDSGEDHRWYQVDMVVFANRSTAAAASERWPRDLRLSYPERVARLKTREQFAAEHCRTGQGYQSAAAPSDEQPCAAADPPLPYVLVADPDPEMREVIDRLGRSSNYRRLFTASWTQPMKGRSASPHLLIRGGDQYGRHFELEGHIRISIERYLHLDTDLWLSAFEQHGGMRSDFSGGWQGGVGTAEAGSHWPRIPLPPPAMSVEAESARSARRPAREPQRTGPASWSDGTAVVEDTDADAGGEPPGREPIAYDLNTFLEETGGYALERVVAMRQHRRMRSGQLHYLDHPLFGIVLKITPVKEAQEAGEDEAL